ncbi:MAG TPA: NADH-quinone oxidoreductase subunit L [Elusimicrobiota bacterium]|jgi:NADH-quinone oxidoreductase subunit L|nr:NADH-quinone oxidoreductase subunit L [Elusimicrobiota bacterium]HND63908.1 NADH-quinone oxidoreductase subunit L [Elusimicrobiota bacterium]
MLDHAYLIPLLPLAASVLILFFGRWLPLEGAFIGIAVAAWGLVHAGFILGAVYLHPVDVLVHEGITGRYFEMARDWFTVGNFRMELGVMIDGMAAMMLVVVTLVSFLVQVYSLGYQHGKPRFGRYYAYLSFFTAAMLILVVSNNLLQFFIGWELMGVSSYLLIGFEFERPAAAYASRKAFITTRVGDLGFYAGLLLLFTALGTANFGIISAEHVRAIGPGLATAIALLLFCGAAGKSAQLPLHVWLPDAMEGPTPVSALIHAATMVAAGVFLLGRFSYIFELSPIAQSVVAWTGGLTALGAALSAITATDIKKVLAYSTISQLGYMVLAMGVGDHQAGMFHLTTHAFFKALLFLGAGSVIHSVHTNEMPLMGGLGKKMPVTFITMSCAWLAIIGFPYISSGFYSKEAILAAVYEKHQYVLFAIAGFTAFLTTFYMTRLMILTFIGTPRDAHRFQHAHESGPTMTLPLSLLAVLSIVSGFLLHYIWPFAKLVPKAAEVVAEASTDAASEPGHLVVLGVSLAALALGLIGAYAVYVLGSPNPKRLAERFPRIYTALGTRYFDAFYLKLVDVLCFKPAAFLAAFDYEVVDQFFVDGVGTIGRFFSRVKSWIDDHIVDGVLVNGFGWVALKVGAGLRSVQTGVVQNYLLAAALGVFALILWAVGAFG